MLKIVGTIVNAELMLIGLRIKYDNGAELNVALGDLQKTGLSNNQMIIQGTTLKLLNNFKLSQVPMAIYMGGDNFTPINNSIEIIGRENNGTEDTAYVVKTPTGQQAKVNLPSLRQLNNLFKPVNFIVNRRADNNKIYITSKPGYPKISDLPIVSGVAKQMAQRTYKARVKVPNTTVSFWNLCETIKSMNGVFIKLPHVKYNAETRMVIPAEDSAKTLDISNYGEFALPEFEVVTTNANLNLSFRAQVKVDIQDSDGNKLFDIWSNKISTKTVYKNGKANLSEIGILVKKTVAGQLAQVLENIDHGRLEDAKLRAYYAKVAGKNSPDDLEMVWVSLKDIPAFVASDIEALRAKLSAPQVFIKELFDYTCVKKALTAFSKIKRDAIKAGNGIKTISPELSHYTPDQLKAIASAGIDVAYNSYTYKTEKTADSEDGKETKSEYAIKWEFTNLKTVNVAANEKLKSDVEGLGEVLTAYYAEKKTDEANQFINQTKTAANSYAKAIQARNIVMLYDGQFAGVKVGNGLKIVPGKTNTYIVIDNGTAPFEHARAAVSGWTVS